MLLHILLVAFDECCGKEVVKVRVLHGALCRDPFPRLIHQKLLPAYEINSADAYPKEIDAVCVEPWSDTCKALCRPAWKVGVKVGEVLHAWPCVFSRSPEHSKDFEQLVDFGVAWEEWMLCGELGKDAANGPHVDGGRVVFAAKEDFGGTVPEGDDLQNATKCHV